MYSKAINDEVVTVIKKYGILYTLGLLILLGLKYYYSKAGSDELGWILAPTAQWVEILSGIPFKKEFPWGFVNHDYRFIIAPSCSGINFMIIIFATLLFSFVHRLKTIGRRFFWLAASIIISYISTILVNGLRIIISIYLKDCNSAVGWLEAERLHMIEGTVIYFASLLVIYIVAGKSIKFFLSETTDKGLQGRPFIHIIRKWISPLFWYFTITLAIPFLNRAYQKDGAGFLEHAAVIITVCMSALLLFSLLFAAKKVYKKSHSNYKI